ncbi:MAG: hypothetical protein KJ737_12870 [Proteobacteria bacterium]|nr:hypothetical protein [Pseudomonadota bacterium]
MPPQGKITTTDIFKGAYFLCCGCDLDSIAFNRTVRNVQIAEFWIKGADIEVLDRDYRSGKARINPLQFREALNHLRDLLFKAKDERKRRESE